MELLVAPPGDPFGAAQLLQRGMARFSDGADHLRRRALAMALLPPVEGLREAARSATRAALGSAPFDVMPLAHAVPVTVLAARLGRPDPELPELIHALCDGLVPGADDATRAAADAAADRLLGPATQRDSLEIEAAWIGLLVQARDATAALVATALLAGTDVETTLDREPPVRFTRRRHPETGELTQVDLATTPFGAGLHACPGARHAVALATGMLDGLDGWHPSRGQVVRPSTRANLRLPAALTVTR